MKLILYPSITLDGFISDLDGECDSWLNEADEAAYEAEVIRCGCLIVGGKTYRQYSSDFHDRKEAITFVCTNDENVKDTDNVKFVHGNPVDILQQVEAAAFNEAVLGGGGEINGLFASAGLINEIKISVYPLTLGDGICLFGSYEPQLKLELLSTQNHVDGIVQNHYKVAKGDN